MAVGEIPPNKDLCKREPRSLAFALHFANRPESPEREGSSQAAFPQMSLRKIGSLYASFLFFDGAVKRVEMEQTLITDLYYRS